jgi:hypothetical protein
MQRPERAQTFEAQRGRTAQCGAKTRGCCARVWGPAKATRPPENKPEMAAAHNEIFAARVKSLFIGTLFIEKD